MHLLNNLSFVVTQSLTLIKRTEIMKRSKLKKVNKSIKEEDKRLYNIDEIK